MNTKNILIWVGAAIIVIGGIYFLKKDNTSWSNPYPMNNDTASTTTAGDVGGKLKVANFTGKLEEMNESCYADGECYVVIGGKHITTILGWRQEVVGAVLGVPSFADLKDHIGEDFEVYAQDKGDGTYTLYGSEGFYIKLR